MWLVRDSNLREAPHSRAGARWDSRVSDGGRSLGFERMWVVAHKPIAVAAGLGRMAGSKGSGTTDGGTSARVLGTFLAWMQEKTSPVFVVATANDVSQLPPEMLRAGRWDQLFFVDLPNENSREAIWEIQIAKHRRDPKDYDTRQLARATDGLTGSELEAVFVEALYQAFE